MKWVVSGADRNTGEDREVIIEADNEDSARRRGGRAGMMVSDVRAVDADDSVAGVNAAAPAPALAAAPRPTVAYRAPLAPVPAPPMHVTHQISHTGPAIKVRGANACGIASIVIAIIGLTVGWIPFLGMVAIPFALIALLLAAIGIVVSLTSRRHSLSTPIIGGALAVLAIGLVIVSTGGSAAAISSAAQQAQAQMVAQQKLQMATLQRPAPAFPSPVSSPIAMPTPAPAPVAARQPDDLKVTFVKIEDADFGKNITLRLTNNSGKAIDAIKGGVDCLDQFGEDIDKFTRLGLNIDEPLAAGASIDKTGMWPMAPQRLVDLLKTSPAKVTFKWHTDRVAFGK